MDHQHHPQHQQPHHPTRSASPSQEVGIFIPDLRGFLRQLKRYWNALAVSSSSSSPWARLPSYDDFEAFCLVALRAYMHANHGHTYIERGFTTDSFAKIEATVEAIRVPLYVYDMIREMARPMILSDHEHLLPYMPFLSMRATRGQGSVPGLGFKCVRDPLVTVMLSGLLWGDQQPQQQPQQQQQQQQMMPIVKENPDLVKCPASICNKSSLVVYGVHTLRDNQPSLPEWRVKACCILRHLQPSCPWYRSIQLRAVTGGGEEGGGRGRGGTGEGLIQPEGTYGKPARFYRADESPVLQRPEEDYAGIAGQQQQQQEGHQQRQQQQQVWGQSPELMMESQSKLLVEGEDDEVVLVAREPAEMPHLLRHLLDNVGGGSLGYDVPLFSSQGVDMLAPFPCERSAAAAAVAAKAGAAAEVGGHGRGPGERAATTAAGKMAGLFRLHK
ncbi:hypothetical protein VYU27_003084 [Nannochloropsis oceanica]